jgi:thiol:disulfide interchange protein DsbD
LQARAALEPFMLLRADVTENDAEDKALLEYFDSVGPPTMPFYDRNGTQLEWDDWWLYGYVPADEFVRHVTAVAAL